MKERRGRGRREERGEEEERSFIFNDTANTEIYTLTQHDAHPNCAATNASANTRLGKEMKISVIRIKMVSTMPP